MAIGAFRIPPAPNKKLEGKLLNEIFFQDVLHIDVGDYAKALSTASAEEIELARPQLFFIVEGIIRDIPGFAVQSSGTTAFDTCRSMLDKVKKQAVEDFTNADSNPKSGYAVRTLAETSKYVAEMAGFLAMAASVEPAFEEMALESQKALDDLLLKVDDLKATAGSRYPLIATIIPEVETIREAAAQDVVGTDFKVPDFSARRLQDILGRCGTWDVLWHIASTENRAEAIKKGLYRPLDGNSATKLGSDATSLMTDFAGMYRNGFVNDLRLLAAANTYLGHANLNNAIERTPRKIENQRQGLYESKKDFDRRVEREKRHLPNYNKQTRMMSTRQLSVANSIKGLLTRIGVSLGNDVSTSVINFSRKGEVLVGVPASGLSLNAIVIQPDPSVASESRPTAVLAASVPLDNVADAVESLEMARKFRSTNYHSTEDCLSGLLQEIEKDFFFKGVEISGHDGFELLSGEARKKRQDDYAVWDDMEEPSYTL